MKNRFRPWTLSAYLGFSSRGPAMALEGLMISNGFGANDGLIGLGGSLGQNHPYSLTGANFQSGAPWMLATYYRFKSLLVIGAIYSNTQIGTTYGHKTNGATGAYLDISYGVSAFSSVLAIQARHILQIGIGPALYSPQTSASVDGVATGDGNSIDSRLGLLVDFSLAFSFKKSLLFCRNENPVSKSRASEGWTLETGRSRQRYFGCYRCKLRSLVLWSGFRSCISLRT